MPAQPVAVPLKHAYPLNNRGTFRKCQALSQKASRHVLLHPKKANAVVQIIC